MENTALMIISSFPVHAMLSLPRMGDVGLVLFCYAMAGSTTYVTLRCHGEYLYPSDGIEVGVSTKLFVSLSEYREGIVL
jgi:hypothetical protein